MALPIEHMPGRWAVLEGGRAEARARDEAHVEVIAFMDEVVTITAAIVAAESGNLVPSTIVINEANRLAYRAQVAKAEILTLTEPPREAA